MQNLRVVGMESPSIDTRTFQAMGNALADAYV